jgi:hypothetical protein
MRRTLQLPANIGQWFLNSSHALLLVEPILAQHVFARLKCRVTNSLRPGVLTGSAKGKAWSRAPRAPESRLFPRRERLLEVLQIFLRRLPHPASRPNRREHRHRNAAGRDLGPPGSKVRFCQTASDADLISSLNFGWKGADIFFGAGCLRPSPPWDEIG